MIRSADLPHAPPGTSIFDDPVDELRHPELTIWRANVGAPVALDLAPPGPAMVTGIDLLSWNVAAGAGRLRVLLERARRGELAGAADDAGRPLVVLLQEAYRGDDTVPRGVHGRFHGGAIHPRIVDDVVEVARAFGLSLRYAPSMRNGAHASDRGNAILSTIPFSASHAFVLPYVRQRRVVVSAALAGVPGLALLSAHLDTGGQPRGGPRIGPFGAGRLAQVRELLEHIHDPGEHSVIVGADLNTPLGGRDPIVRALVSAGMRAAARVGTWRHTYHGPLPMVLDHVLFRSPDGRIARVRVHRIDERAGDIGWRVFGSDHHPLLARIDFREPVQRF